MKTKIIAVSFIAAWLSAVVSGSLVAAAFGPFLAPRFGELIRDPQADGLLFPALLAGYGVIAAALVSLYQSMPLQDWAGVLRLAGTLGIAVFVGDHLVTAGWSHLELWAMLLSGGADVLAVVVAGLVMHLVWRRMDLVTA